MAIAPSIVNRNDTSGHVAASYCDRNRLYVRFAMDIDADMPPLAGDFSVLRDQKRIKAQSIDVQIGDQQSMIVLVMNDTFLPGEELTLCYKPTQWLMCEFVSGEAVDPFDEIIYPQPLDALEPSLRLLTKFEPTLAPEAVALDQASVNVRFAAEYRLQLYFQVELDTTVSLDPDDFRAETEDRWIRITTVRHAAVRANSKAEILLELSEPVVPGTRLSLAYRSSQNRLRSVDAAVVAPFKITCVFTETEHERVSASADEVDGELPDFFAVIDKGPSELKGHSAAELLDESLDDESSLVRDSGDAPLGEMYESPAEEEADDLPAPAPVVKKELVVRAKTITEKSGPATVINAVKDPAIAAAIAEKAARIRESQNRGANALDDNTELSFASKVIYFVPIVVIGWLMFIVCVYLASIAFDISMPSFGGSSTAPTVQPQNLEREKCSLTSEDGSKYEGECLNGDRDGFGSYVWTSGNRYDGNWRNGVRHGEGKLVYASGAVYEGEYRDGKEHGKGAMVWPNGASYEGQYQEGRFHGRGVYITSDGNKFEGLFKSGSMTQDGTCTLKSGERYPGPCRG